MSAELQASEQDAAVELPGRRLQAAREALGRSPAQIAEELRLSTEIIEALESGDSGRLPGAVFVRGYLRSYAALVGLPADEIIDAYNRSGAGGEQPDLARSARATLPGQRRAGYVAWLLVLAVALAAGWWWQRQDADRIAPDGSGEQLATAPEADAEPAGADAPAARMPERQALAEPAVEAALPEAPVRPEAEPAPNATERADGVASAASTLAPEPDATAATSPSARAGDGSAAGGPALPVAAEADGAGPEAAQPQTPTAAAEPQSASATRAAGAPGPAGDTLMLRFAAESWVEVHDARDERLLYRLAAAGEERTVSGEAPFRVLLGNAPGVQVRFNGKPVDIAPHIRGRTARLTVGE